MTVADLAVRKDGGDLVPYNEELVRRGVRKASVRTNPAARIDGKINQVVDAVSRAVRRHESNVISTQEIGALVLKELRRLDPVTHVRFALVYLGRRDQRSHDGWESIEDVRTWLLNEYPLLLHYRPPKGLVEVVKKDGSRVPFDNTKLERSIGIASKGRGRSDDEVKKFATDIAQTVHRNLGDQPLVTTGQLAAEILHALRNRDHVAFLRYASTAKGYASAEDYENECVPLRNR